MAEPISWPSTRGHLSGNSGLWAFTSLGRGDGTYGPATAQGLAPGVGLGELGTYQSMVADINGDGKADIVAIYAGPLSGNSGLWAFTSLGRGDGTYEPATAQGLAQGVGLGALGTYKPMIADVDGDGRADIVAIYAGPLSGNSGLWAYTSLGRGDGTYGPATVQGLAPGVALGELGTYQPMVADINGDGRADIVAIYAGPLSGNSGLWAFTSLSRGDGSYEPATAQGLAQGVGLGALGTYKPMIADVDGDGRADIVAIYAGPLSGNSGLWAFTSLGRGDGTYAPATAQGLAPGVGLGELGTYQSMVADINGDGKADIVAIYAGAIEQQQRTLGIHLLESGALSRFSCNPQQRHGACNLDELQATDPGRCLHERYRAKRRDIPQTGFAISPIRGEHSPAVATA